MQPSYVYNAVVVNVVDGDTIDARVDLGFNISTLIRFRLYGIDTPELTAPDVIVREVAEKARAYVKQYEGQAVTLRTYKPDKYGRWLADVYTLGTINTLNQVLIERQLAVPYFGEAKSK